MHEPYFSICLFFSYAIGFVVHIIVPSKKHEKGIHLEEIDMKLNLEPLEVQFHVD